MVRFTLQCNSVALKHDILSEHFFTFFDKQKWGGDSEDHDASHRYDPGSKPGGNTIILSLFYTKAVFYV